MLRRIFPILIVFLTTVTLSAQTNSPYSRYGLGNIFPTTFGASNGMGSLSAAYLTPTNINVGNPSSYAEFNSAILDVGISGRVLTLNTETESFTSGDGNLANLALGFPMLKNTRRHKMGIAFGLLPYSSFSYAISEEVETDDPDLGIKQYDYVGEGDIYQIFGGLGYRFQTDTTRTIRLRDDDTKDTVIAAHIFNIGGNTGYLFGNLYNLTYASFPDVFNSQTTKLTRESTVNGGLYTVGVSYQRQYIRKAGTKRDYLNWRFGGSVSPAAEIRGNQSVLWTNILKNGNYEFVTDTLYSTPDTSGTIQLPLSYQAGVSFAFFTSEIKEKNQFILGADYSATQWSAYQGFQDAGVLGDSWRVSIGAEFIPNLKAARETGKEGGNKYKPQISYRLGAYNGMSNIIAADGEQLTDYGATLGMAIPIGRNIPNFYSASRINLYLNVGQRGGNTTLSETYYNFGVSFSVSDSNWFQRYKLN